MVQNIYDPHSFEKGVPRVPGQALYVGAKLIDTKLPGMETNVNPLH